MERIINYTADIDDMYPKSPQYAGVQGEHNVTSLVLSFSSAFTQSVEKEKKLWDYMQFRIDYTDSFGNVLHGESLDINNINKPFYLTRAMTKGGGNTSAVLKIICFNNGGSEKEFYTGIMRLYFAMCPSVLLAEEEEGSVLSPIVNQTRNYRNEAYDSARVSMETEDRIQNLAQENRRLNEETKNNSQIVLNATQRTLEIEEKVNDVKGILNRCEDATALAQNAASGVVTIEQNKKIPLKISVMTQEEYDAAQRPDPDGCATLDIIEDDTWVNFVYPVGSIYMSVNNVEPATLFGGTWQRIKDKFLLSCGDTYKAGTVGGEAKHTLTQEEMPRHLHALPNSMMIYNTVGNKTSSSGDGTSMIVNTNTQLTTMLTGETAAHNNMPPYLAVYMWERIA